MEETGKKVLVTTSAHMENPKNFPLKDITEDDGEAICALLKREGAAAAGLPVKEGGKLARFPAQSMNKPQQRRTVCF